MCWTCGTSGAVRFNFKKVTGTLVSFTVQEFPGQWCRDCGRETGRMVQNHTLIFGWLGFIVPLISALIVASNTLGLIRVGRSDSLANNRTRDPGRPIWLRPGPTISLAIVLGVAAVISALPTVRQIDDLRPGDCINDDWGATSAVHDTELVSCEDPHDFETFATVRLGRPDDPYPGDDEMTERTYRACMHVADEYLGRDFLASPYEIQTFSPTRQGWRSNDRTGTCLFLNLDGSKLHGSVRPSA
ncbi:MAG: septum formation family protein [Acidimicrobiales bacterium]